MKLQTLVENKSTFPGLEINIEQDTAKNKNYRKVLFTTSKSQLVLMSLKPGEEIGEEKHNVDQFIRFETGQGKVILNGVTRNIKDGSAVVIPKGVKHNVINTSTNEDLKLYTIYSPAHHKMGTVLKTKEQADKSKTRFDGETNV